MGEECVEDDGCVQAPVSRVVVDEYGVDFEARGQVVGDVRGYGVGERFGEGGVVVAKDFGERPNVGICGEDVPRCDHALEAISFSDSLTFIPVSSCYEHGLVVVVGHVGERRMGLDEIGGGEWDTEFVLEVCYSLLFGFAAAVGEEDKWDSFGLEVGEGFSGTWKGGGGAEEDAIDAGVRSQRVLVW